MDKFDKISQLSEDEWEWNTPKGFRISKRQVGTKEADAHPPTGDIILYPNFFDSESKVSILRHERGHYFEDEYLSYLMKNESSEFNRLYTKDSELSSIRISNNNQKHLVGIFGDAGVHVIEETLATGYANILTKDGRKFLKDKHPKTYTYMLEAIKKVKFCDDFDQDSDIWTDSDPEIVEIKKTCKK